MLPVSFSNIIDGYYFIFTSRLSMSSVDRFDLSKNQVQTFILIHDSGDDEEWRGKPFMLHLIGEIWQP